MELEFVMTTTVSLSDGEASDRGWEGLTFTASTIESKENESKIGLHMVSIS